MAYGLMRRAAIICAALIASCGVAASQPVYPVRPITLVVPFAPGGPTDVVGRLVAQGLSRSMGQPVIVENVAGNSGVTGSARVARAAADGYTLVVGNLGTHAAASAIQRSIPYDPRTDFAPIGVIAANPMLLIASPKVTADGLPAFIAHVRANAPRLNFGSAGVGATSHLACALFNSLIGVEVTHVPYRGTAPVLTALIAGEIDYGCDQTAGALPQVLAGTVKGVAIATPRRSPAAPDLPTGSEQGLEGFQASAWNALFAPKGTPPAIIARLAEALDNILLDEMNAATFAELGAELPMPVERGPAALAKLVAEEMPRWAEIVRAARIAPVP